MLTKSRLSVSQRRPQTQPAESGRYRPNIKPHSSRQHARPKKSPDLAESTSNLTILANKNNQIHQLRPFDSELSSNLVDCTRKVYTQPSAESQQLKPSTALTSQPTRMSFMVAASRELDRIISRKNYRDKKHRQLYRKYAASLRMKTEEEALGQQYVDETKRAQRSRQRVRREIEEKVARAYPHRVNRANIQKNCFLTDMFAADETKVERIYKADQFHGAVAKSLACEARTTFYSLSKRKCVVVEDQFRANREFITRRKPENIVTYVSYLTSNRPGKMSLVGKLRKNSSADAMRKSKKKILGIWKVGSHGHADLTRCFQELGI